ncbi:MAG: hypothetical protein WCK13_00775 [Ignavibacteriota bacterium]|nr:hypothetical protein [Ignavibacteriota bacterium]
MLRFLGYLFLFYIIYFVIKHIVRIYSAGKAKKDTVKNTGPKVGTKPQIDKDKIVDAKYEEL